MPAPRRIEASIPTHDTANHDAEGSAATARVESAGGRRIRGAQPKLLAFDLDDELLRRRGAHGGHVTAASVDQQREDEKTGADQHFDTRTRSAAAESRGRAVRVQAPPVRDGLVDERVHIGDFRAEIHDAGANGESPADHRVRWKDTTAKL